MERARVAVCLAVRDGMPYLPVAVDSILAQTLWQLEILVVDDGSSDGTAAFLAGLADARVRVLTQPGAGLAAALNRCIDTVAADYIARMDADDIARPERLAEQLAFMVAHPDVAAAGSWIEYFADAGRRTLTRTLPTGHDAIVGALTLGGHGFCHPTLVIRTAAARQAGGYRVAGPGQMTQFALALARVGRLANLDRVLLAKRVHPRSVSWREAGAVATAEHRAVALWHAGAAAAPNGAVTRRPGWPARLRTALRARSQVEYRRALVAYLQCRPVATVTHAALASLLAPVSAFRRVAARVR